MNQAAAPIYVQARRNPRCHPTVPPFKPFVAGAGKTLPLPEMFCLTRQSPGHTLFENFGAGDWFPFAV
jgi:hypothetical protein